MFVCRPWLVCFGTAAGHGDVRDAVRSCLLTCPAVRKLLSQPIVVSAILSSRQRRRSSGFLPHLGLPVDLGWGYVQPSKQDPPIHKHVYVALPSASFSALRGPGLKGMLVLSQGTERTDARAKLGDEVGMKKCKVSSGSMWVLGSTGETPAGNNRFGRARLRSMPSSFLHILYRCVQRS